MQTRPHSHDSYEGLPALDYPFHDKAVTVTTCGRICFKTRKIKLSQVFAGQTVGIKQTEDRIWLVNFMQYDLGYFDDETCRLEPLHNPFGPKSVTYISGMNRYLCVRNGPRSWWCPGAESNHRHADFQSAALPTELPGPDRRTGTLKSREAKKARAF